MEARTSPRNWFACNLAFAAAVYFGVWQEIQPLAELVAAFVFLMLLLYATALTGAPHARTGRPVALWISVPLDLAVIAAFVYRGWPATGAAYVLSIVFSEIYYHRARQRLGA